MEQLPPIEITADLTNPHPLGKRTKRELAKHRSSVGSWDDPRPSAPRLDVDVPPELGDRAPRIFDLRREKATRALHEAPVAALLKMVDSYDRASSVRKFLAGCRSLLSSAGNDARHPRVPADVSQWLAWADSVAAKIDPFTEGVAQAWDAALNVSVPRHGGAP